MRAPIEILPGTGRGTSRRLVEGAHISTSNNNRAKNAVQVFQHVPGRYSHNAESLAFEQRIASRIAPRPVAEIMPLPIDFDDYTPLETSKVRGDRAERKLPPEFQAVWARSENLPY